ncbi:MAG: hypothetical protein QW835_00095 [Candidatus Hadarchaeum sp.]
MWLEKIRPSILRFMCTRWTFTDFRFYDPSNWKSVDDNVKEIPNILRSLFSPFQTGFLEELNLKIRQTQATARRQAFADLVSSLKGVENGKNPEVFGGITACLLLAMSMVNGMSAKDVLENASLQELVFEACARTFCPKDRFTLRVLEKRPDLQRQAPYTGLMEKYGHMLKFQENTEDRITNPFRPKMRHKKILSIWDLPGMSKDKLTENLQKVLDYQNGREIDPQTCKPNFLRIIPFLAKIINKKFLPAELLDTLSIMDVLQEEVFFRRELQDPELMLEVLTTVVLPFYWLAYKQEHFLDNLL